MGGVASGLLGMAWGNQSASARARAGWTVRIFFCSTDSARDCTLNDCAKAISGNPYATLQSGVN